MSTPMPTVRVSTVQYHNGFGFVIIPSAGYECRIFVVDLPVVTIS